MDAQSFLVKTAAGAVPFTQEACIRTFEPQYPIPQNPSAIVYRERFMQLRASYSRPAVNTPHPHLPQVYFAEDVDFQDRMAGVVEWTRVYTTIPNTWTDFETYAYTFPGYTGVRVPLTRSVTAKLTKDYFLVGSLPTYQNGLTNGDNIAAWASYYVTLTANATNIPVCAGGTNGASLMTAVTPSQEHYVLAAASTNANAAVSGAVFFKPNSSSRIGVSIVDQSTGLINYAQVSVDASNQSIVQNVGTGGVFQAIGDGWFRVGLTGVPNATNSMLRIVVQNATGATNYTVNGTAIESVFLWRAQLTQNENVPHSTVVPTLTPDSTNYPVQSADLIPVKFGQQYLYNWAANTAAEFLSGATTPTLASYQANVNIDQNAANANIYSIEAQDSDLKHWQGTIWERTRTFVKAR